MREITETATRSRSADCVQLFEAQTARTPEATAVVFGDAQLSYRELNARANQLARELLRSELKPDSLVGICLERSPEMVVAVLATLKAGVPSSLDRIIRWSDWHSCSRMRRLCRADAICATGSYQVGATTLCLDSDWQEIEKHADENLNIEIRSR